MDVSVKMPSGMSIDNVINVVESSIQQIMWMRSQLSYPMSEIVDQINCLNHKDPKWLKVNKRFIKDATRLCSALRAAMGMLCVLLKKTVVSHVLFLFGSNLCRPEEIYVFDIFDISQVKIAAHSSISTTSLCRKANVHVVQGLSALQDSCPMTGSKMRILAVVSIQHTLLMKPSSENSSVQGLDDLNTLTVFEDFPENSESDNSVKYSDESTSPIQNDDGSEGLFISHLPIKPKIYSQKEYIQKNEKTKLKLKKTQKSIRRIRFTSSNTFHENLLVKHNDDFPLSQLEETETSSWFVDEVLGGSIGKFRLLLLGSQQRTLKGFKIRLKPVREKLSKRHHL